MTRSSPTCLGRTLGAALLFTLLVGLLAVACTDDLSQTSAALGDDPPITLEAPEAQEPSPTALPPTAPASATPAPSATPTASATPAPSATPEPSATPVPTLSPYVVVIDPGHGGYDLGARRFDDQGRMVYHESTVNLELGLLLRDELQRRGLQVVMTRDGDYSVNGEDADINGDGEFDYTVDESQARVDVANAAEADLLLSLHQNAFEYPDGSRAPDIGGSQTFYCADRPFGDDNHRFAALVHQAILTAFADLGYDMYDRGVQDDYYLITPDSTGQHLILLGPESERIMRPSQMPGALSEPLYITHEVEGEMAQDPAVLARLAQGYADAIEAFFRGEDVREP